ncbi:MAG: phage tail protein, partial [Chitinophagales bacterium]
QIKGFTHESHFKEVSGLTAEREVELIVEGGNNDYVHKVPKGATKYNNLVLKRGLISSKSALGKWCLSAIGSVLSKPIKPKTIDVELQDPYDKSPVMKWSFTNAWPVKWEVSGLDSQKSEILIESIEFAYNSFSVS